MNKFALFMSWHIILLNTVIHFCIYTTNVYDIILTIVTIDYFLARGLLSTVDSPY